MAPAEDPPIALPASSYGTPSVAFWNYTDLNRWIETFENLDSNTVAKNTSAPEGYRNEILELVGVLKASVVNSRGVYVFASE